MCVECPTKTNHNIYTYSTYMVEAMRNVQTRNVRAKCQHCPCPTSKTKSPHFRSYFPIALKAHMALPFSFKGKHALKIPSSSPLVGPHRSVVCTCRVLFYVVVISKNKGQKQLYPMSTDYCQTKNAYISFHSNFVFLNLQV